MSKRKLLSANVPDDINADKQKQLGRKVKLPFNKRKMIVNVKVIIRMDRSYPNTFMITWLVQ